MSFLFVLFSIYFYQHLQNFILIYYYKSLYISYCNILESNLISCQSEFFLNIYQDLLLTYNLVKCLHLNSCKRKNLRSILVKLLISNILLLLYIVKYLKCYIILLKNEFASKYKYSFYK